VLHLKKFYCVNRSDFLSGLAQGCRQLQDVHLEGVSNAGMVPFLKHCPDMVSFHVTTGQTVTPAALRGMIGSWQRLQRLILLDDADSERVWTADSERALSELILGHPTLTDLVCIRIHLVIPGSLQEAQMQQSLNALEQSGAPQSALMGAQPPGPEPAPLPPRTVSALRTLWVDSLLYPSLQSILCACPLLQTFGHVKEMDEGMIQGDPQSTRLLAASGIRDVSFSAYTLRSIDLLQFTNLTALRLWYVNGDVETALPTIVARSPGLKHLFLHLLTPNPATLPRVLKHTPGLQSLHVMRQEEDDDEEEEEDAQGPMDADSVVALCEFARIACPSLQVCELQL
jgi:hypothetical protein